MRKALRNIGAVAFAGLMSCAMGTAALADPIVLHNGEAGGYTTADTPNIDDNRVVKIVKEIVAYNPIDVGVFAPEFDYVYTVSPATIAAGTTVTDAPTDHGSNTAVTVPVHSGVTTGLKVGTGSAGTAVGATGTLSLTNTLTLDASHNGTTNRLAMPLDFSDVTFTEYGVYRYQIAETLGGDATYAGLGIVDGNSNTRYLDVYVDGEGGIYGYVCLSENGSVTPSTAKTDGFVDGAQDKYYTYDLTISKDVVGDSHAEANNAFPYTVIFDKHGLNGTFKISESVESGSTGISPTAGQPTWSGVAKVKEGGDITYHGIPCGATVDIYETNDVTGVTYTATTEVNGTTVSTDNNVVSAATPATAVAQTTRANSQSTKQTIASTLGTPVSDTQTYKVTNRLVQVSPTGIALRYAPYALTLAAGGALFAILFAKRRKDGQE